MKERIRTENAIEFRGAAHDLGVSRIILPKSTKIFVNLQRGRLVFSNLLEFARHTL